MTDGTEQPQKPTSDRSQAKRAADYKKRLKEKGFAPLTVHISPEARPLFIQAAELIRDGTEPAQAFRIVTGNTEKTSEQPSPDRDRERQQHAELMEAIREGQQQQAALRALIENAYSQDRDREHAVTQRTAAIQNDRDREQQRHAELMEAIREGQRLQEALCARMDDPPRPGQDDRDREQWVELSERMTAAIQDQMAAVLDRIDAEADPQQELREALENLTDEQATLAAKMERLVTVMATLTQQSGQGDPDAQRHREAADRDRQKVVQILKQVVEERDAAYREIDDLKRHLAQGPPDEQDGEQRREAPHWQIEQLQIKINAMSEFAKLGREVYALTGWRRKLLNKWIGEQQ
jgi:hypothetical protein